METVYKETSSAITDQIQPQSSGVKFVLCKVLMMLGYILAACSCTFIDTLQERMFKPLSTIITENTNVAVVSPSDPVYVATKKMREHRVSSAVIVTDDKLQGILTSKDVLRRVMAENLSPESTLVEEAMMPNPKSSTLDTTIVDSLRIMHNGKFLHLPVLDRDGHVAACLDVLQITRAAISMLDQSGQSYPATSEGEQTEHSHGSQLSNFNDEWSSLEFGKSPVKQLMLSKALTIPEETTVYDACRRMAMRRVDAVVLTNSDGLLSGIFTARDLSTRVIAEKLPAEKTMVSKVMTRKPIFVMVDTLAFEALQRMVQGKFRHLPVVENGEVIAMLHIKECLYDVMSRMEKASKQETLLERMLKSSLSTIITENTKVAVVSPSDPVYVATKKMHEHQVNSVVIVTENKLQGILTSKALLMRVVAQNLCPELTLVEKVMTPDPECSTLEITILDALHMMHDGRFLKLPVPVLDRDGHVTACLDDLQMSRAVISMFDQPRQSYQTTSEGVQAELSDKSQFSNFRDEWASLEVCYLDIKKATNGFSESSEIGRGGYGSVYKGKLGGTMVAIKKLDSRSKQGLKEFFQELEVLYQMRHPHLVKLVGACFEVRALVYEYLPNGSLGDCLEYSPNLLTWQMRTRVVYEICSALIYLHSKSVVHGDLKPANILLDANFKSKLADFGLCRFLPEDMTTAVFLETAPKGTTGYIDPWFFETSILRPGSDLYSFGITILKLLTRLPPVGLGRKAREADENAFREMIDPTAGSWPFDLAKELLYWSLQCCYRNERSSELLKDMSTCLEEMLAEIETLLGGSFKRVVAEGKKAAEDPLEVVEVEEKNEEAKEEEKPML